jgi:protoporphyrinogen IX oxidase
MLLLVGKIVHVIGNILWLGGGALAAFAFLQLASSDAATRKSGALALRKSALLLVTPGMLLSFAAGLTMLLSYWSELYAKAPWMHMKLTVGLIAAAFSGVLSARLRKASEGHVVSPGSVRLAGIILVVSAIAGVSLVLTRFGQH